MYSIKTILFIPYIHEIIYKIMRHNYVELLII